MGSIMEFQLQQQTPMIHYQAYYPENTNKEFRGKKAKEPVREPGNQGLALRGSEVKPKLDRFLQEWYKRKHGEDIPEKWKTEYDPQKKGSQNIHEALNYRLQIIAPKEIPLVAEPPQDVYFGNMGNSGGKKYTIFYQEELALQIRCFIPDLCRALEECIPLFFLMHNFGTRQDKGLGGFITTEYFDGNLNERKSMTVEAAEELLAKWLEGHNCIVMDYSSYDSEKRTFGQKYAIGEIGMIYRLLKSGINSGINRDHKDYVKSALTEYFLGERITGEKREMKRSGVAPVVWDDKSYEKNEESLKNGRYIRGLFGYGGGQRWFSADKNHAKVADPKDPKKYIKENITIAPLDKGIERIPSPLLFKVVEKYIFIIPCEINKNIYGKEFRFSSKFKHPYNISKQDDKRPLDLCIPSEKEFDLDKFMKYFSDWLIKNRGAIKYNPCILKNSKKVAIRMIKGKGGKQA
ncbi:MAG: hypothetical protein IJ794_13950 [Lachnospiraceae bacterium]|nr:hypothetical protein [Lachnospiraceae bacterium]